MFSIDSDFAITNYEGPAPAREDVISFSDQRGLAKATTGWLTTQYVDLWNSFAGVPPFGDLRPVKKFTDRNTAIKRIWQVLSTAWPTAGNVPTEPVAQPASEGTIITTEVEMPKPTKKARVRAQRPAKAKSAASAPDTASPATKKAHGSRKDTVMAMIARKNGATLPEIMEKTGWQAHSVRGFIATLHTKHGVEIASSKNAAGERVYQATA
jgi:hypothetical protein